MMLLVTLPVWVHVTFGDLCCSTNKRVMKISILMMKFHFYIFEAIYKLQLAIKCSKFQDAYKRPTSTGVHILFSSIYIALGWALSSFISFSMKLNGD